MGTVVHPFPYHSADIIGEFWQGYEGEPRYWEMIAPTKFNFGKQRTKYFNWPELLSTMQDWTNLDRIPQGTWGHREYTITRAKYGLNIRMEEEDLDDDATDGFMMQIASAGAGWPRKQNQLLATLMDGADSTDRWDGVPFFDTAHPGVDSTGAANENSNALTETLSYNGLLTAFTTSATWYYQNGELITPRWTKLVVPSALYPEALKIVRSITDPTVATGAANVVREAMAGLEVVHFPNLTDTNKWYLLDTTGPIPPFFYCPKRELRILPPPRQGDQFQEGRRLEWSIDAAGAFGFSLWFKALQSEPS